MTLKEKLLSKNYITNGIASLITQINYLNRVFNFNRNKSDAILVISLHKLGDTVLTIPTIKLLKDYFNKSFYILCSDSSAQIYKKIFNDLEYLIVSEDQTIFKGRILKRKVIKKIKNISPSTIVDLTGSITSAYLIFRLKSKNIVGINEEFYKGLYTKYVPIRKEPHLIDIYLDVIRMLSPELVEDSIIEFPIRIKQNGLILIHPFAGWAAKEWSFNNFLKLYDKLNSKYDVKFLFEKGRLKPDALSELKNMKVKYSETKDIKELLETLSNSSLLISNDSGPIHVASLIGIPTFGIYGPTHPDFHVPFGKYHRFINKEIKCSPKDTKYCFTFGGRFCPTYDCMHQLSAENVLGAVESFINDLGIFQRK